MKPIAIARSVVPLLVLAVLALAPQSANACVVTYTDVFVSDYDVSATGFVEDYFNSGDCFANAYWQWGYWEHTYQASVTIQSPTNRSAADGAYVPNVPYGGASAQGFALISTTEEVGVYSVSVLVSIACTIGGLFVLEELLEQLQAPNCNVTITEDTIFPGTLPVWNPARVRTGYAPVFWANLTPPNCPVSWSIVSGPGTIIGSTTSDLATVRGDSVGTIQLRATTSGGNYDQISVPVVDQRTVNVGVWIVRDSSGANAAATEQDVSDDIQDANLIWVQCGVQFNLVSTLFKDNTTYLVPNDVDLAALRNLEMNTGGIEIYYVNGFFDHPTRAGEANGYGVVIGDLRNTRTAAHELGHAMGLVHAGVKDRDLMHEDWSPTIANIKLSECNALMYFTSL